MSWDICDTVVADGRFMGSPSGSQQEKRSAPCIRRRVTAPEQAPTPSMKLIPLQLPMQTLPRGDKPLLCLSPAPSMGKWGGGKPHPHPSAMPVGSTSVGDQAQLCCRCPGESGDAQKQGKAALWAEARVNPAAGGLQLPSVPLQRGCKRPPIAGGTFWNMRAGQRLCWLPEGPRFSLSAIIRVSKQQTNVRQLLQ